MAATGAFFPVLKKPSEDSERDGGFWASKRLAIRHKQEITEYEEEEKAEARLRPETARRRPFATLYPSGSPSVGACSDTKIMAPSSPLAVSSLARRNTLSLVDAVKLVNESKALIKNILDPAQTDKKLANFKTLQGKCKELHGFRRKSSKESLPQLHSSITAIITVRNRLSEDNSPIVEAALRAAIETLFKVLPPLSARTAPSYTR